MRLLFLFYIISSISACQRPSYKTPPINEKTQRIFVQQSEVLFFYNVRSLSYKRTENPISKIRSFALKEYPEESLVNIEIQHAWDREEAYLKLSLENYSSTDQLTINWIDNKNQMKGKLNHTLGHPIKDFMFVQKISKFKKQGIELLLNNKPIFTEKNYNAFHIVLADYNKLISLK